MCEPGARRGALLTQCAGRRGRDHRLRQQPDSPSSSDCRDRNVSHPAWMMTFHRRARTMLLYQEGQGAMPIERNRTTRRTDRVVGLALTWVETSPRSR
jgi:hypothetical protein